MDALALITKPGPEAVAVLGVFVVGLAAACACAWIARRERPVALSLVGVFGLIALAALVALRHLPTRLTLDRTGVSASFWLVRSERAWPQVASVELRESRFGAWLIVHDDSGGWSAWPRWPGLLIPAAGDLRRLTMQIEAWRVAAR